jgi:hypothetical protein
VGDLLLHHPLVHFYLLFVAALGVAFVWDYWRHPSAVRSGARTPPNQAAQGGASPPHARSQQPGSSSGPGRRTKQAELTLGMPR